ncbi:PTS mannose/fructose/sorbose/N-acetylgalactosamine transporter subunit IIC [Bacillus salipaludis]|uniref:PTS mannose/fructose/sorbose/N-acetylgalactosamine transporter subunit IIC n=1 Tax=Bacillus salipaludis TaxID=2547811 RepID=A0ABW8RJY2_9BACI
MELLWTALIVGIVAGIAECDGYGWGQTSISRPTVVGMLIGFVLGDLQTGLIVGGTIELAYLGLFGVGAALPPDLTMATAISSSLAILSGLEPNAAVAFAIPVAVAAQFLSMLVWTGNIGLIHRADVYAKQANFRGIDKLTYTGTFLFFLQGFIPAFLAILLGVNAVKYAIELIPPWVMNSLTLAGGILPAVGFAMLFNMMSIKKLLPYFIIGFALASYLNISLLGMAVLGIGVMLLYVYRMDEKSLT